MKCSVKKRLHFQFITNPKGEALKLYFILSILKGKFKKNWGFTNKIKLLFNIKSKEVLVIDASSEGEFNATTPELRKEPNRWAHFKFFKHPFSTYY